MNNKLFAVLSACLVVAACQIEEFDTDIIGGNLYAHIETFADTKTFMNDQNQILWSEGDQVAAFLKSSHIQKYQINPESIGKTSARFDFISAGSNDVDANWDRNVVYYPYSTQLKCMKSSDIYELSVSLPATQYYSANSFGNRAMPMVGVSKDNDITFRNICGGVKLLLKGTQKVTSIKVEGRNGELLSGSATVTAYADESKPTITMDSGTSTSVTLNCGSGVPLNESTATEFIIVLPPVIFSKGFVVTVTDSNNQTYIVETDKSNTVFRSSILLMPEKNLENADIQLQTEDYIDEYGINHGPGIAISEMIWAPVNCGYHATDYPWGKLYQWGRKYGQGYIGKLYDVDGNEIGEVSDATVPIIEKGCVSAETANHKDNENIYYLGQSNNWIDIPNDKLWNVGTESNPIKTEYDPCPDGWRVPTYEELDKLRQNCSSWMVNDKAQPGCWLSGDSYYSKDAPQIFLPASGSRNLQGMSNFRGLLGRYWSSTEDKNTNYKCKLELLITADLKYNENDRYASAQANGGLVRCIYDKNRATDKNVSNITLSSYSLDLYTGSAFALNTKVYPESSINVSGVIWSTSDSRVATVSSNGVITAVSPGHTIVTAQIEGVSAKCKVCVKSIEYADYMDEFSINHGPGIAIGEIVWAPVNCGYHATDYPWGKLYQWGRKYGQGYIGKLYDVDGNEIGEVSDATVPIIEKGCVSAETANHKDNENIYYLGQSNNWIDIPNDKLWNVGTESNPIKTEYDPCPDGWRVPTYEELDKLRQNRSLGAKDEQGLSGFWFSGESAYLNEVSQVFLPLAGSILSYKGSFLGLSRGSGGYYWVSDSWGFASSALDFTKDWIQFLDGWPPVDAYSVRCVQEY